MLEIIRSFWLILVVIIHVLGFLAALEAIWNGRTAQGSIAWAISLIFFPYIALPLYYIFGGRKFFAYIKAMRIGNDRINELAVNLTSIYKKNNLIKTITDNNFKVIQKLAKMPFICNNEATLLINGKATFRKIFSSIAAAQDYVLIQFYMVHNDELGNELQQLLIAKAKEGIRVYFLYDDIGSHRLPKSYGEELLKNGVQIRNFKNRKKWSFKPRLNFRNHRKIVVVDGREAFLGGCNVSTKYLGTHPGYGFWRDTNVKIQGPAVQALQLPFISDWYWSTSNIPDLNWQPQSARDGKVNILSLPSGPADKLETCGLFFVNAINMAKDRLWIVSPYFVPDHQVLCALQLAALRNVDVRLIIPQKSDLLLTYLSSFSYLEDIINAGVKVFRYHKGYLHEKVMLIDNDKAVIGTANLDNRSFRINFEINLLFADPDFAWEVEEMISEDLQNSIQVGIEDYLDKPVWFKLAVKISRLMAPIQ